jgi:hypothetical protein
MAQNPDYLVAIDLGRQRVFVMARPSLCAIKMDDAWRFCEPLPDEEIGYYKLVTDAQIASKYVLEAKSALGL